MPQSDQSQAIIDALEKDGLWIGNRDLIHQKLGEKAFKPLYDSETIGVDAQAVASLFAVQSDLDVVLGDLPEFVYRQEIANSLTLLQLQNIFKKCSREVSQNPGNISHTLSIITVVF